MVEPYLERGQRCEDKVVSLDQTYLETLFSEPHVELKKTPGQCLPSLEDDGLDCGVVQDHVQIVETKVGNDGEEMIEGKDGQAEACAEVECVSDA